MIAFSLYFVITKSALQGHTAGHNFENKPQLCREFLMRAFIHSSAALQYSGEELQTGSAGHLKPSLTLHIYCLQKMCRRFLKRATAADGRPPGPFSG
ncbi:hypothetical protein CesoFtcFv8_023573 [Champsocephalus esox]|uniref:Uncharacterized protein n=2 Tax=Champsocephalus TaxID=52236 RepID=A0AAN8CI54_CHAGU|nr:hypothetical protein CesoFtcFv8_023573 [Champsocephalus esox]KAK5904022.1 hypothetical protein CgunFtcFv8_007750 [Champsocephalus gunnari]